MDELEEGLQGRQVEIAKIEEERSILETQAEALRLDAEGCKEQNRKLEQENVRLIKEVSERTPYLNGVQVRVSGAGDGVCNQTGWRYRSTSSTHGFFYFWSVLSPLSCLSAHFGRVFPKGKIIKF